MFDVTLILEIILVILVAVFGLVLLPRLRKRFGSDAVTFALSVAKDVVYAAQQLFPLDANDEKFSYAFRMLKKLLAKVGLTFDEDELQAFVESAYRQMKKKELSVRDEED